MHLYYVPNYLFIKISNRLFMKHDYITGVQIVINHELNVHHCTDMYKRTNIYKRDPLKQNLTLKLKALYCGLLKISCRQCSTVSITLSNLFLSPYMSLLDYVATS